MHMSNCPLRGINRFAHLGALIVIMTQEEDFFVVSSLIPVLLTRQACLKALKRQSSSNSHLSKSILTL